MARVTFARVSDVDEFVQVQECHPVVLVTMLFHASVSGKHQGPGLWIQAVCQEALVDEVLEMLSD
jgi:hypothetical protein